MNRLRRLLRATRVLVGDERLPRWLLALLAFGVAPIPLFADEVALVLAAVILWVGYRDLVREAWAASAASDVSRNQG